MCNEPCSPSAHGNPQPTEVTRYLFTHFYGSPYWGTFGVHLVFLSPSKGTLESFAPSTQPRIPQLITQCVNEIEKRGFQEVGIFSYFYVFKVFTVSEQYKKKLNVFQ